MCDLRRHGSVLYKVQYAIKAFQNILFMPFTIIATILQEPLLTVHAIYNKPSTPQYGGFSRRTQLTGAEALC